MNIGTRVRLTEAAKAALRANEYTAEHVAEFGDCVGTVIDVIAEDCVDVRWQPSGLRYLYDPRMLVEAGLLYDSPAKTTDARLDEIYDRVDRLLREGEFGKVDLLLLDAVLYQPPIDEAIALLTATLPAKSKLCHRSDLWKDTATRVAEEQLRGLE